MKIEIELNECAQQALNELMAYRQINNPEDMINEAMVWAWQDVQANCGRMRMGTPRATKDWSSITFLKDE
jgi:hypothetical protein